LYRLRTQGSQIDGELADTSNPTIDIRKRRDRYYKKALKVKADIKRANCPY
jgi:hypothetical protein